MYDRTYVLVYYYYRIYILTITPLLLHCYLKVSLRLLLQLLALRSTYIPFTTTRCSSANAPHARQRFGERTSTRAYPRTHPYQLGPLELLILFQSNTRFVSANHIKETLSEFRTHNLIRPLTKQIFSLSN